MERKQIAIFGWKVGENSYGITLSYYDFLDNFGDVNILPPVAEIDFNKYDLLIVPGGPDVSPNSYGHVPSMFTGKSDPIREYFDKYMIPQAIEQGIPIVGICRGHQSIAVHFGGKLRQHMYHKTNKASDRTETVHDMKVSLNELPDELADTLKKSLNSKTIKGGIRTFNQEVNSIHHQVVKRIPEEAVIVATHLDTKDYANDRSIEALYYPRFNIFTFQYHPEEIWDNLAIDTIHYLLSLKDKENEGNPKENLESAGAVDSISV